MGHPAPTLLATQKSALSETLVANLIQLQTRGRVRIARPRPDDHGVDLKAYVAGAPAHLEVQVKASYTEQNGGRFEFRVDASAIPKDASHYVVLAVLGTNRLPGLANEMWLIPGEVIQRRARGRPTYVFAVYPSGPGTSQWDRYQLERAALGQAILSKLRRLNGKPLPRHSGRLSLIAQGMIVEDAITFELLTGSNGRLAMLRPFADTAGVDLEVLALDSCVSTGMQVKGRFVRSAVGRAQVRAETFRARSDRYLVVATFLAGEARLGPVVWVLREDVFGRLASRRAGMLEMVASPAGGSRDRWVPYRYAPSELAGLFERIIAVCAVGRVRELPDAARHAQRPDRPIQRAHHLRNA